MFLETRQHKRDLKENDVAYLWFMKVIRKHAEQRFSNFRE